MKPYLTGGGRGSSFISFILDSLYEEYGRETAFRLTVALFNKRAVTLYTRHGFMKKVSFQHNGVEFVSMIKPPLFRRF
jgi:ribosomal protein S18 acetylase RimI-like enzyme